MNSASISSLRTACICLSAVLTGAAALAAGSLPAFLPPISPLIQAVPSNPARISGAPRARTKAYSRRHPIHCKRSRGSHRLSTAAPSNSPIRMTAVNPAWNPLFFPSAAPSISRQARSLELPTRPAMSRVGPVTTVAHRARKVSLDFVEADINDVVKAVALQSGTNIITTSDIKGTITVQLKDVSLIQALDMVARLSGNQYREMNGTVIVGPEASLATFFRDTPVATNVAKTNATISFVYSVGDDLQKSVAEAFPGAHISLIHMNGDYSQLTAHSEESNMIYGKEHPGSSTQPEIMQSISGGLAPGSAAPKQSVNVSSKGGVLNVFGTPTDIDQIRQLIQATETALNDVPTLQRENREKLNRNLQTRIYHVAYADPDDLRRILVDRIPAVQVQFGPNQRFILKTSGGSASAGTGNASPGTGSNPPPGSATDNAPAAGASSGAPAATESGGGPGLNIPNVLILTGTLDDLDRVQDLLTQVDVRSSQLAFEARVMDINNLDSQQLGLRYDVGKQVAVGEAEVGKDGILDQQGKPATLVLGQSASVLRNLNFGAIFRSPYTIGVTLDALANNNRAKVLASPNLSALDGQASSVFIGDEISYVDSIIQGINGLSFTRNKIQAGITLRVTGKSSPDGNITLYVHPEVSTITSFVTLPNGISIPQVAKRVVDTTIRVKDGETIAIGGLIQEQDIKNIQKVPILGNLPFFGQLFRSTSTRKTRSNVIVFITSHILKD